MATFTTELRTLIKTFNIGLDDYEIFDADYRDTLNKRIIDHYYFHEIGYESVEMFVHQLNHRMRLGMPFYNQIYSSTLLKIDPLQTMSLRTVSENSQTGEEESTREQDSFTSNKGTATSDSSTKSKARTANSQFPQNMLNNDMDYATAATDSVSDTNVATKAGDTAESIAEAAAKSLAKDKSSGKSDTFMSGYTGSQADLVLKYRRALLNVDEMVIESLADLFMSIVNTGDSYSELPLHYYPGPRLGYGFGRLWY